MLWRCPAASPYHVSFSRCLTRYRKETKLSKNVHSSTASVGDIEQVNCCKLLNTERLLTYLQQK